MKNLLILLSCSFFALTSCKNEGKKEDSNIENATAVEDLEIIKAEFINVADAAVLKGDTFIYGVVLDDKAKELTAKVTPMKNTEYDMVPVRVKGIIKDNTAKEGWDKVVEIKEIVEVLPVVSPTKEVENSIEINVPE